MTLEDFFTLTEMRDGLTAPARVRELVFVMEKEKYPTTKSSGDAIRQWAAVASSITATESRECVDLFLQLDGLSFMNRWLVDAEKFNDDTKDGFVEESINVLLSAIDKLQLDSERSVSSGIWTTINNLLDHHSTKVQNKARALLDSWKPREMENSVCKVDGNAESCDDANRGGNLTENIGQSDRVNVSDAPSEERPSAENCVVDVATNETELATGSSHIQPEKAEDEKVPVIDDEHPSQENLNQAEVKNTSPVPLLSSSLSNSAKELRQDGPSTVPAKVLTGAGFPDNLEMQQSGDGQTGVLEAVNSDKAVQRAEKVENPKTSMVLAENTSSKASDSRDRLIPAETDAPIASLHFSGVPTEIDDVANARLGSVTSEKKDEKVIVGPCQSAVKEAQHTSCCSTSALNSHERELNQRKIDDSRIFFSKVKYGGASDDLEDHSCSRNEGTAESVSYRLGKETRGRSVVDRNRLNAELDYGIDALEVARQVAQEVEREVVDRKERFCSSPSERDSGGGLGQAGSPESVRERDLSSNSLSGKLPRQNNSSEASSDDDGSVLENQNAEPENSIHDMGSSQVTEASQDPEDKTEKGFCAFDLNQEVCSDDVNRAENAISAPISVVCASKPAASSGVPSAPLQFEGFLGWKGSAATSAFRPASPRRSSIGDKTADAERIGSGQKISSLNIDLNVAESGDDKVADLMLTMPIPVSSSLRSGESSVEVSSRRPEKLGLDLNRLGDDGEPSISDFRRGPPVFYHLNSHRSPSPASSSSSMQPSTRNFDLNDRPLMYSEFTEQGSYGGKIPQKASIFGKSKQDPVISILGAKVELNKKDHVSQTLPLLNGNKGFETVVDAASLTTAGGFLGMGPGNPYQQQHPPNWALNGLTAGPTVSLAPAVYRTGSPIPYMMDPRGVPAVHQPAGSIPTAPFPYPQAPAPFMMSMSARPFSLNGPYPSPLRPHLDLNSGFSVSDGVNRESTMLRQFFVPPDHARPTEEHVRGGLPPASGGSGVGTKRKEPDGGWEPYPLTFRQQQPPWK